jgi:hypothetical protein
MLTKGLFMKRFIKLADKIDRIMQFSGEPPGLKLVGKVTTNYKIDIFIYVDNNNHMYKRSGSGNLSGLPQEWTGNLSDFKDYLVSSLRGVIKIEEHFVGPKDKKLIWKTIYEENK